MDDAGVHLTEKGGAHAVIGRALVYSAPWLMKFLSIAGTAAMFLVGGGILVHSIPALAHWLEGLVPDGLAGTLLASLGNAVVGMAVGALVVAIVAVVRRMRGGSTQPAH